MSVFWDRVKDTTTTTGTGDITLSGTAPTGYVAFGDVFTPVTDRVYYAITNAGESEWEVGYGSLSDSVTLVREIVLASSNSNLSVSFSAGTKTVFHTVPAFMMNFIASAADAIDAAPWLAAIDSTIAPLPGIGKIEAMRLGAAML